MGRLPNGRFEGAGQVDWADAYLAAFATVAGLRLGTFDQAFRGKSVDLLILDGSVTENNS